MDQEYGQNNAGYAESGLRYDAAYIETIEKEIGTIEKEIEALKNGLADMQGQMGEILSAFGSADGSVPEEDGIPEAELSGEDDVVLTIEAPDGHTYKADLLCCFTAGDLERDYCAVLSHETKPDGSNEIQLFRYALTPNDDGTETIEIEVIPSDMEFEDVREEFERLMDGAAQAS